MADQVGLTVQLLAEVSSAEKRLSSLCSGPEKGLVDKLDLSCPCRNSVGCRWVDQG